MPPSPAPASAATPTRAIVFLAFAGFASQAMVRVADPLLPQIAHDLDTTIGTASVITSGYAVAHATMQLFGAPLGDRFPKYGLVMLLCTLCAGATAACGFSDSLQTLAFARLACGLTAGAIIPLAMAFIGDAVPYERRQPVLGRFLAGQILGLVSGQIVGGVVGDHFGWRTVFFVVAGLFVFAAACLLTEFLRNPVTRAVPRSGAGWRGLMSDYASVFMQRWALVILFGAFIEFGIMFGAFAYIGADLHARAGLSFSAVGGVLAAFGAGGLAYVMNVQRLVDRLGQIGLVAVGGAMMAAANIALAVAPIWWVAFIAVAVIGLGFHMVHNTLQVNATQMAPQARATAVGVFSSALYLGQSAGVAAAAPVVDRFGAAPVFVSAALAWPILCWWLVRKLRRRQAQSRAAPT